MPFKDAEKRRISNRKWNGGHRDVCKKSYAKWIATPRGWAVCIIKNARAAAAIRSYAAPSYSPEDLVRALKRWDHSCDACGRLGLTVKLDEGHSSVTCAHVDHDHVTGALRGFVCPRCNTCLGFLEDRERLAKCETYLTKAA
jgi:hypothetical protein